RLRTSKAPDRALLSKRQPSGHYSFDRHRNRTGRLRVSTSAHRSRIPPAVQRGRTPNDSRARLLLHRLRCTDCGGRIMRIRQFTLSAQAKEQLIRLKIKTGIEHWNVLCRWAFCLSLKEDSPPSPIDIPADSNVELSWQVFGGEHADLYLALLIGR